MSKSYGGTESFIMSQVRNNKNTRDKVYFLNDLNQSFLAYNDEFELLGISVISVGENEKQHPIKFYNKIKEICIGKKIDALVINVNTTRVRQLIELFAARQTRIKIRIVHSHNSNSASIITKINRMICFPFIQYNFLNLVTNRFACSYNAGRWEFGKQDFLVIKNGINTKEFNFSENKRILVRNALNIADDVVVFLHVGRISKQKNTFYLVNCFLKYYKENKNSILIIAGGYEDSDDEYQKVKSFLQSKGKSCPIILLGVRKDVQDLMFASDVFLLPSLYEGFPIVAVEAQCSGLVCVLSNTITQDVNLTGNVMFIPLDNTYSQWIAAMKNAYHTCKTVERLSCAKLVLDKGYEIKDSAEDYWNLINYNN